MLLVIAGSALGILMAKSRYGSMAQRSLSEAAQRWWKKASGYLLRLWDRAVEAWITVRERRQKK
jgi:DNA-binding PadR family transcriptional regulator